MSLRYAMLGALLDGDASGYELAKRFDSSVANFWHALPQQLYQELGRMEEEGLVAGEAVLQTGRPNKRVFSITAAGRDALIDWLEGPYRMRVMKDELLVKMYAADLLPPEGVARLVEDSLPPHVDKLAHYEALREMILRGRNEEEFLRTTNRVGPYLTLMRGIEFERQCIDWARWVVEAMRVRAASPKATRPRAKA